MKSDQSLDSDNDDKHEMDLCVIKNSYNTYIPHVTSQKVDCSHHCSQNSASHLQIITLIEHALENNDALMFCMNMKQLKQTCLRNGKDCNVAYPEDPPDFIPHSIKDKFKGYYVSKTPLWAIQHCLSEMNCLRKSCTLEISNLMELSTAADGAYIICGLLNPDCIITGTSMQKPEHPHDPLYDVMSCNAHCTKMTEVVLYFPSTGTYYSPCYLCDTSHL